VAGLDLFDFPTSRNRTRKHTDALAVRAQKGVCMFLAAAAAAATQQSTSQGDPGWAVVIVVMVAAIVLMVRGMARGN